MKILAMKQYIWLETFLADQRGQDLIEYAMVVALICFAATTGTDSVANKINVAFSTIDNKLTTYTT